jgi:dTMP kinase
MEQRMSRGKYIVIEGPEGVGKTTQVSILGGRLREAGLPVRILREPDSQSDITARTIRHLTQDKRYPMNTKTEVLLYNAARSQSLGVVQKSIENGIYCVVDRNYLTTLAVQYYGRGDITDYEAITKIISFAVGGIEPDLTVILDAPADVLKSRLSSREGGERFDNLSEDFLERVRAGYLWEAKERHLPVLFGTGSTDEVADNIWNLVTPILKIRSSNTSTEPVSIKEIINDSLAVAPPIISEAKSASNPGEETSKELVKKTESGYEITEDGKKYLSDIVTSVDDNVYAFSEKMSPITIAAAMARLSRRGDDMRITILDEFANSLTKDEKLLQRVITAYGDDSVQQLTGQHLVVEGASNLLTKKLEWGRLAAYLEQSTRYIYFDQKDSNGNYKYYVPEGLKKKTTDLYKEKMDALFGLYSDLVRSLTHYLEEHDKTSEKDRDNAWRSAIKAQACDAIRPVLPVATKSTVGIYGSAQAIESLIMHLMSDKLNEARVTGQKILANVRIVSPVFYERADKPDRGGANIAYRAETFDKVESLANELLSDNYSEPSDPVELTNFWPRNELDLVADMLYEHSSLPLSTIKEEVQEWSLDKKTRVFESYLGNRLNRRHKPGRAIEKAHYSWDLVCDYGIFRDLQRHRMVDNLQWQQLSPRYGYDIPKLVEDADLIEKFEECFNISLELHSEMQRAGYIVDSQYATLLGHKMRWQITYNAREAFHLHELRTSPQGHPGYRKLVLQMHEKLAEVHPMMAAGMRFVNQGEDAELTRLAAERYTQFKLSELDKT